MLRSAIRARSHLRGCLVRCRDCRIFFPTHPRNAGRRDLRCPFGCRQKHGKRSSTNRSVMYYRTEEGRFKKSMSNAKRRKRKQKEREAKPPQRLDSVGEPVAGYSEKMIEHIRMSTSLFEGRKVSRQEVLDMLEREKKRQQGMGEGERTQYRTRELTDDSS